jgi:hypothetical protein
VRFAAQRRYVWADYEVAWWLWHWFTGGPLETGRSFAYDGDRRARHLIRRAGVGVARTGLVTGLVAAECVRSGSVGSIGTLAPTITAALVAATIIVLPGVVSDRVVAEQSVGFESVRVVPASVK